MTYAYLCMGRDESQIAQLDLALAPDPVAAQETLDRQNMRAMQALGGQGMVGRKLTLKQRQKLAEQGG